MRTQGGEYAGTSFPGGARAEPQVLLTRTGAGGGAAPGRGPGTERDMSQ